MDDQHAAAETDRQYGELYYRADAVAALLRAMAEQLEGDKRGAMLRLSSSIPTTMYWDDSSEDVQQSTELSAVCRLVQLRLQHDTVLGSNTLRLDALLRRGPSPVCAPDGEHLAGVADEQPNAK